ncbi:MAG: hypothetical protein K0R23_1210 [Lacrimispora sp.]|nr:hypothetical protein [Lacrimispora sp.]
MSQYNIVTFFTIFIIASGLYFIKSIAFDCVALSPQLFLMISKCYDSVSKILNRCTFFMNLKKNNVYDKIRSNKLSAKDVIQLEIELNKLIKHLSASLFQVRGVYRYNISIGTNGKQKASPYPGFIFPLSGCAEYQFNNTPYLVTNGTIVHGLADATMRKRVVGEQNWEFISILYETFYEPPGLKLAKTHFDLSIAQSPQLLELLHQIYAASNRPGGFSAFQVETLFRRILEETFLCARNQTQQGAQELFETVSEYIHVHYMDVLSVSSLAQQNGVNENRLFYIFQKYAGIGPGDYLRTYRLNRARDLLVTSTIPINVIAEQVGYPDALYFSRIFKKNFGMSPSKYR